jgi:hypothetical protein
VVDLENSKIFWFKTLFVYLLILFFCAESDQRLISFSSFKDHLPECGWVNTVPRGIFFYQMGIHQGHPDLPRFWDVTIRALTHPHMSPLMDQEIELRSLTFYYP